MVDLSPLFVIRPQSRRVAHSPLLRKQYHERLVLHHLDHRDLREEFRQEVEQGLSASPKRIPPKFFYDRRGSELFEKITKTEEYYPTRTEAGILAASAREIVEAAGTELTLIEFGSGSSTKTRLLLDVLTARQEQVEYVPIDISPTIVQEFGPLLLERYGNLEIRGLITDYHHAIEELNAHPRKARLFLFLGSSLGNFSPDEAHHFLSEVGAALEPQDRLLLGVDLIKQPEILDRAYNDSAGVTAAFNLNLLTRINRELRGHFDLSRFRHLAFFNKAHSRIEMHLESLEDQTVRIDEFGRSFSFARKETVHTENSHKYDYATLTDLFGGAGMTLLGRWCDPDEWFALNLLGPA
ncbi:MAG: L-histidine N(alpha)-methyltransferase [SAR324 cluster bacterium]|nr:L-histidine N(alpha)-methyltransferase [SAR324 cluster bacterium]